MRYPELTGFVISMLSGVKTAHPELSYSDFLSEQSQDALPQLNASCWGIWQNSTAIEHPYTTDAMDDDGDWAKAMEDIDDFTRTGSAPCVARHSVDGVRAAVEVPRRGVEALGEAGGAVDDGADESLERGSGIPDAATAVARGAQGRIDDNAGVNDCK